MTPDRILLKKLTSTDKTVLQRVLNSSPDKEISVSVTYFSDFERGILFTFLSPSKRERVIEEIKRGPKITYNSYRVIIDNLLKNIETGKRSISDPAYFRPSGKGGKR